MENLTIEQTMLFGGLKTEYTWNKGDNKAAIGSGVANSLKRLAVK